MFRIYDGREQFFQWDLDRKLIVEDASITEVHFCNRTAECALPVATYKEGNLTLVNVPNLILQESFRMNVYAYDGKHTKHAARFEIVPRSKPDTYVYTETEIKSWDDLFERVTQIEENGISDAAVEAAIEKYLEENDIRVDLTGYATEEFVRQEIGKIDIPETDLTGYATEKYVQEQIKNIDIPEVEQVDEVYVGANAPTDENIKIWVDTDADSPVATKEYVAQKVAEAQLGGDVDLSAYYTKTETDALIEEIELTPGPAGAPGKDGKDGQDYVLTEADKQEIAGMIEVPEGGGGDDFIYWEDTLDPNGDGNELSDDEVAKLLEVSSEEVSITLKNHDDNSEITFKSNVYYDEYGSTLEFQGVEEATDGLLGYLYVYTDTNTVDTMLNNTSGKADIKIFVPGQRNYYTKDEIDDKLANIGGGDVDLSNYYTKEETTAAINEALSAIGIAEEVSF